jgi:cytochrome c oxidase assembly factor CtaG
MTTRDLLLGAWAPGLVVPLACAVAVALYAWRYRRRLGPRAALFALALGVFFVALASPIAVLARGYLFSAHMLQHLLLMLCVPPLVLLGLPRERGAAGDVPRRWSPIEHGGSWLAGVGAMWLWHIPVFCNAAATSTAVQGLQTVSLVVMGFAFWRPVLAPRTAHRLPAFAAIAYLFAACVACTVLGILVTFSPVEICSAYAHPVDALGALPLLRDGWGLSCKVDQEIGGLLMWVPTCFVYAGAILATLGRYYAEEQSPSPPSSAEASAE